jgi:hypothetical protein
MQDLIIYTTADSRSLIKLRGKDQSCLAETMRGGSAV